MTASTECLVALAKRVDSAERQLKDGPLYWAQTKVEEVTRDLERGSSMNKLGELQATGPGFDVAISRLEEAVEAFKIAWSYLSPELGSSEWLEQTIAKSPRLTAEVDRMNQDRAAVEGVVRS
jgi:hypothetical protein